MSEKTISAEVGTKLLFENERVRVWDLQLAPGQSTGLHRHEHDYLYVVIGDGRLQGAEGERGAATRGLEEQAGRPGPRGLCAPQAPASRRPLAR